MWPFHAKERRRAWEPTRLPEATAMLGRVRADVSMTGSEAIYAAVSRISNTMASLPLHLYRGRERQADDPLERLAAYAPNDNYTPFTFLQTMEAFRNTEGRAYAFIVPARVDGGVARLDIIDPLRVTPLRDRDTGEIWYRMQPEDGAPMLVPGCRMLALKYMSANGEMGIRPLDVLRGTLDFDKQVKEFSLRQLESVNNGVVLEIPGVGLNEERKKKIVDQFLTAYKESGGRLVVLEGGVKATTLARSPVDAKVLDVERITKNRVAAVYNIPPHLLGDYAGTSLSTAEQQMREFLQLTILPIVAQWEQELARKLLTYKQYVEGYRFRFDLDALDRADTATMADKHQKAIRGGWMMPNEVREREGLPPDPSGNKLMTARDLIPLSVSVNNPELLLAKAATPREEDKEA